MAREYRNGFGVAYRELEKTSEELEALFQLGQIRLSPEEIKWRRDAIKAIKGYLNSISETLDDFELIAPPPIRKEEINN
jgi:hypothetical protein